jgi:hemoglobin/transferrin/lactoferrin receptor protein
METRQSPPTRLRFRFPLPVFLLIALGAVAVAPAAAQAPPPKPTPAPEESQKPAPPPDSQAPGEATAPADSRMTVTESVTVVATGSPDEIRDTPTPVTVIDSEEIEHRVMKDTRDLVRWVPGVYVENDVSRRGLNGFNIRGIGGNRVQTQIDGVRTAEQFDFGPVGINQYALDLDALRSVEIVRSAGSALYGSDALGGVVSFTTLDPRDYLALSGRHFYLGARAGYDARTREFGESFSGAFGSGPWQGSLFAGRRDGHEVENQGTVDTEDASRTKPNPQDRSVTNLLAKVAFLPSEDNQIKLTGEWFEGVADTDVFSLQGETVLGPSRTTVSDMSGRDEQTRHRLSLEQDWKLGDAWLERVAWRLSYSEDQTLQDTVESRLTQSPTRTTSIRRSGELQFDQESWNADLRVQKRFSTGTLAHLATLGGSWGRDLFDMFRDRVDVNTQTGAIVPGFPLIYPTKYFPRSEVVNYAAYLQDEISVGSGWLRLVPGVRFDQFDLDPDENDPVYLSGNAGTAPPVGMSDSAFSPRIGAVARISSPLSVYAQYARGFRAPAYSFVNNGFTNLPSGYTTLPNPNLKPESSDNFELGLRGTFHRVEFSVGGFDNRYEDFIDIPAIGIDPATGLILFQPQNINQARIRGIEAAGSFFFLAPFSVHASYALLEGENTESDQPLNSIPPDRLVLGLRWAPVSVPIGAELTATLVSAQKDVDATVINQFQAPAYQVFDLTAFYDLTNNFSIQVGVFNLFDEKYWTWSDVQGVSAASPVLDRYTSPGISTSASLRWRL